MPRKISKVKSSPKKISRVKTSRVKTSRVKTSRVKTSRVKTSRVKSIPKKISRVKSSRVKSSIKKTKVKSSRVKSSIKKTKVKSSRVKSSKVKSSKVKSSKVKSTLKKSRVSKRKSRRNLEISKSSKSSPKRSRNSKITVRTMTGKEYEFDNNGDTYGDLKRALLRQLDINPKPLLRDMVLADSNYTVVNDMTRIPFDAILLYLLNTREWTEREQAIINQVSGERVTIYGDLHIKSSDIAALAFGLENNLVIRSLSVHSSRPDMMPAIENTVRQSRLRNFSIDSSSVIDITGLADAFRLNNTIEMIYLSSNSSRYGITGMTEFSNMIGEHTSIRSLYILANLRVQDVQNLAGALIQNNTLQELSLGSSVEALGAIALADALQINTSIVTLNLQHNKIDNEGAVALAEALQINTFIVRLNLEGNKIGDVGARALLNALQINRTIQTINFSYNKITKKMKRILETEPRFQFHRFG